MSIVASRIVTGKPQSYIYTDIAHHVSVMGVDSSSKGIPAVSSDSDVFDQIGNAILVQFFHQIERTFPLEWPIACGNNDRTYETSTKVFYLIDLFGSVVRFYYFVVFSIAFLEDLPAHSIGAIIQHGVGNQITLEMPSLSGYQWSVLAYDTSHDWLQHEVRDIMFQWFMFEYSSMFLRHMGYILATSHHG